MPTLTIKNVPEETVERLREQAKRHHRSMQGELMAMLEGDLDPQGTLTPDEAIERIKALGIKSGNDATRWIREDRDAR